MGKPEKSLDCLLATIRLSPPVVEVDVSNTNTSNLIFNLLPRWSTGPGVSPELIRDAIKRLEQLEIFKSPSLNLRRLIMAEYTYNQETLDDLELTKKRKDPTYRTFFTLLPWERIRAKRFIKQAVVCDIELLEFWRNRDKESSENYRSANYDVKVKTSLVPLNKKIVQWREQREKQPTEIFNHIAYNYTGSIKVDQQIGHLWQTELFRRLAIASLVIRAYQLEHDGKLPGSLDDATMRLKGPLPLMVMPCGPAFGFRSEGFREKQCIQPGICIRSDEFREILYERPSLVGNLAGTPCIVLDTKTLYEAYGLFPKICPEAGGDKILGLPDQKFYSIPTVYPLPFVEKKQEQEKEEKEEESKKRSIRWVLAFFR